MLSIKEAKAQARILRTFLTEHQVALPHGVVLEAVARLQHKKNWATFLADTATESAMVVDRAKVANWPVYVFYLWEDEQTLEEGLYVLPGGVRMDDPGRVGYAGQILTKDGTLVPDGFKLDANIVAFDVQALVPAVDKYGLPWFASQNTAADGFRKELGCAAVTDLTVTVRDTNDDGAERFWFEAYVHPDVAKTLPQLSAAAREEFLTRKAYEKTFDKVFADLGDATYAQVMDALQNRPRGDITNRTAESFLQQKVDGHITINGPWDRVTCSELLGLLKARAKAEYEKLVLRK